MFRRLMQIVLRTPVADPVRWLYRRICPLSPADKNSRYDAETLAVMKRILKEDSNCVDVGAHSGSILRLMLECAPRGQHLAFEPLPDFAKGLRASFAPARVFELALSDTAGRVSFQHVVSNPAYSGMRRREYPGGLDEIQVITVQTERLDNVIPDSLAIAFIKIDVEGAELGVLQGAVSVIKRCRPFIVFEHGLGAANHYGTTPANIYDFLAGQCGLQVNLMRRWLLGKSPFTRAGFIEHYERGRDFYYLACPYSVHETPRHDRDVSPNRPGLTGR
jgi:FkbM family methyltransferase